VNRRHPDTVERLARQTFQTSATIMEHVSEMISTRTPERIVAVQAAETADVQLTPEAARIIRLHYRVDLDADTDPEPTIKLRRHIPDIVA
jgi:hypothetical protein